MAENDGDKAVLRPAVAHAEGDTLNVYRVADSGKQHSCQEYFDLIKQLDPHGANLAGRMDAESGHTFASKGITEKQLDDMLGSNKFSSDDKRALQTIKDGFKDAAKIEGDNEHMTVREVGFYLLQTMGNLGCRPDGTQGPPQNRPGPGTGELPHRRSKA